MCWQARSITVQQSNWLTENATITFPISFTKIPALLIVGFCISSIGSQRYTTTLTQFTTQSDVRPTSTSSYLAIGN